MLAMRHIWTAGVAAAVLAATFAVACGGVQEDPETGVAGPAASALAGDLPKGQDQESSAEARVGEILSDLNAAQRPEGTVITLPEKVLFEFAKADLKPESAAQLDKVAEVLRLYPSAKASIRGFTDSRGTDEYNLDLARRRARSVEIYLTGKAGIDSARVESAGLGEQDPVAPNEDPDGSDNPAGREQNRRVEIVVEGVRR